MKNLLLFFSVLLIQNITAQTFFVSGLNFNITSTTARTVEVSTYSSPYQGDITIPALVSYQSQNYSVTNIGASAFKNCTNLTSVIIPNSITGIGDNAFFEAKNLTTITISKTVTTIGLNEFYDCTSLQKISVLAIAPPITPCPWTFYNIDKTTCVLEVPVGSKTAYQTTTYWNQFQIINEVTDIGTALEVNNDNQVKIYASNGQIVVEGVPQNENISVYTFTGIKIYNFVSDGGKIMIPCGNKAVYLVRIQNKSVKVIM
jgi:hypothetical protein